MIKIIETIDNKITDDNLNVYINKLNSITQNVRDIIQTIPKSDGIDENGLLNSAKHFIKSIDYVMNKSMIDLPTNIIKYTEYDLKNLYELCHIPLDLYKKEYKDLYKNIGIMIKSLEDNKIMSATKEVKYN